jgi:hypothetical protein
MELSNPAEPLTCHGCGWHGPASDSILTRSGDLHIRADCPDCGRYLKFVAQHEPTLFFGKYRGKTVAEIAAADRGYLEWLVSDKGPRLSGSLRKSVEQVLDQP